MDGILIPSLSAVAGFEVERRYVAPINAWYAKPIFTVLEGSAMFVAGFFIDHGAIGDTIMSFGIGYALSGGLRYFGI